MQEVQDYQNHCTTFWRHFKSGFTVPLKRVLVVNEDDENPVLVSYEKIFEVCFYCGRRRGGNHSCSDEEVDDGCFMIERVFDDEPKIFP